MNRKVNQTGRSRGEGGYVRLFHWMMRTAAWKALDPNARAAYVELASYYTGKNNGRIFLSERTAAKALGIGKKAARLALRKLEAHGFIVASCKGGFNVKERMATEYRLTEFDCNITGELATKEFGRWCATDPDTKPKSARKKQNVDAPQTQTGAPQTQTWVPGAPPQEKNNSNWVPGAPDSADSGENLGLPRTTDSIPGDTSFCAAFPQPAIVPTKC